MWIHNSCRRHSPRQGWTPRTSQSLHTLHWDQAPTDQDIRDLLDIPDDAPPSHYQQSCTSQPSVFTLSEASSLGPSASQAAPPSYHTGTDTTAQRDNEIKRLRQKIRHVSLYSLWAMECYRKLEGRRGQTATRLQADDAYRPLLHSTLLWPGANTPGVDMTPGQLMGELIPTFHNVVMNDN